MDTQHFIRSKPLVCLILIFLIIGIVFVSGCVQQRTLCSNDKYSTMWEEIADLNNKSYKYISLDNESRKTLALSMLFNGSDALQELNSLSCLEALSLTGNLRQSVSNISSLSKLTNLKYLNLQKSEVSDISPLEDLVNLEWLDISYTKVFDLSPLTNLKNLKILDLKSTDVSDISALSNLISLEYLGLSFTNVSDISALSNLNKLEYLDLFFTNVSDISCLENLSKLKELDLGYTKVSDIPVMNNLTNLEILDLFGTRVSDVSALGGLVNLKELYLGNTEISNVSPLSNLTNLEILCIDNTYVSDISPLMNLNNLKILRLENTNVPVKDCEMLKQKQPNLSIIGCNQKIDKSFEQLDLSTPYKTLNYTIKAIKTQNITLAELLASKIDKIILERNQSYYNYFTKQFPKIKEIFYFEGKELPLTIYNKSTINISKSTINISEPMQICGILCSIGDSPVYILFVKEENQWKLFLSALLGMSENIPNLNFKRKCNELCENDPLGYCTYYFEDNDFNKNRIPNELIYVGLYHWPACEDRVYCFLYVPCKKLESSASGTIMEKCAELLCNNYLKKYEGDKSLATKEVLDKIKTGSCDFSSVLDEDNWHKEFFPENVCEKYINKTAD